MVRIALALAFALALNMGCSSPDGQQGGGDATIDPDGGSDDVGGDDAGTTDGDDAETTDTDAEEVEVEEDDGPPPPDLFWSTDFVDLGEEFVLRGVWGADPNQVVAVGNKSTIIEYTGEGWEIVHQNTELDTLNAVWGTSLNNVWAVGAHGAILHRDAVGWDIGTACTSDAACDDSDGCTIDTCGADGKCIYTGSGKPGCCGVNALSENWESGQIFPWFVEDLSADKGGVIWNVAALSGPDGSPRATSGVYSLYFGIPGQQNFDNGSIVASSATSGQLPLPEAAEVTTTFQVFIDTESSSSWDKVELRVLAGGVESTVWTKEDVGGTTGGQFVPATADLSQWQGQTIQLQFFFDSADPFANGGEGVYIDDLLVTTTCGTSTGTRFPTLWDVWGTGPDNVYAVGNEGTIIHYDGTSWKRQAGGEANDLFGVGINADYVAAGGAEGEVFTSLGGGLSVDQAGTTSTIRDVVLLPGTEAVAVGGQGTIVRHENGLWLNEVTPTNADLHGAWTDGVETVAVGAGGTVLRQDGVGPWVLEPTGQSGVLYDVWGASASSLLAVGDKGLLMVRENGAWSKQGNLVSDELRSIHGFSAAGLVVAVGGGGTIVHRTNGVWGKETSPTTFVLHGVWGANTSQMWAVGNLGTLLSWNGAGWSTADSPTDLTLYDIEGRAHDDVYAVGQSGVMLHWDGVEWEVLRSNTTANLRAVWGLGPNNVYAVGAQATIMHFNGLNWSQIKVEDEVQGGEPVPVVDQLFDVWGEKSNDLWAVGADGTLIHTETESTTGEIQWVKIPQDDNPVTVRGIVGQDAENMWLVGRDGLVIHFDPPSLELELTESIATLYDAIRFDNGEIIAVGNLATILRRGVFAE